MENSGEEADPYLTSNRRRAPTITIDTSAVAAQPETDLRKNAPALDSDLPLQSTTAAMGPTLNTQTSDNGGVGLLEARESRPTSPHNVSSPVSRTGNDAHNFLSVPNSKSRGNSVDSNEADRSPSLGGETFVSPTTQNGTTKPPEKNSLVLSDEDALRPDPGTEAAFHVENNNFAFSPGQLGKLYNPKSLGAFHALGGLEGIEKGLRTNRQTGLSGDERHLDGQVTFEEATRARSAHDIEKGAQVSLTVPVTGAPHAASASDGAFADRKRVFGDNRLPEKKSKSFLQFAWMAYKDKILLLLTAAAAISLALGLYETFGADHKPGEPKVEWIEGVAICVAIFIVVLVGALNDWQKERQFNRLNRKKDARNVKIIRSGVTQEVSVYDVYAGDVMLLEPGDLIPVDGIFIQGHNIKCDESSATGESDLLRKYPADEVMKAMESGTDLRKMDPFILSGAKVQEGVGTFLVTATGVHSSYGKTMMSLRDDSEITPLQTKLNILATYIAKLGGAAALLLFVVLLIKFLAGLSKNRRTGSEKGQQVAQILVQSVTIVVVAVPEGLPLAVTLALAFAMTRMIKQNNLVRVLRSCETMGNATTVCSDKTGTLTQNVMTVVAGVLGNSLRFGNRNAAQEGGDSNEKLGAGLDAKLDDEASPAQFAEALAPEVKELLEQSIVINSTAFEGEQDGVKTFIGSKTETALLLFARDHLGMGGLAVERSNANIVQLVPFDSARKCMAAVVKRNDGSYRLYVKGASEILLGKCEYLIENPTSSTSAVQMTSVVRETLEHVINLYASRSLRTIGIIYRDFAEWPPKGARTPADDPTQAVFDDVFKKMTFLGVVGIQDPLRPGVREAVADCQRAGIFVRMVTGDNVNTAKAIAQDCGILRPGGLVLEGPVFRTYSEREMEKVIPKLCVLARSSPEDKRILAKRLKEQGETVAVTGDGTNDAPALRTADVGFSMGIAGTEVAKEASDIILMDDNFSSIVVAIMWGRAVNDSVRKFLQFQLTVNVTAVVLAFISAVASSEGRSVLTAVQLLWVNLIMDTFAALALATDPPTRSILNRKPSPKSAPLISLRMWKTIIGQSIFQLVITFLLHFGGAKILSYDSRRERDQLPTLVFNTFVWMQIFNQINCRRLDNRFNIFEGLQHNWIFSAINCVMIGGQVLIIFVGGRAFSVQRLNGPQWVYSIVLGALSLPVGVMIRLVPDELIRKFIPEAWRKRAHPEVRVTDEDGRYEWNQALVNIRDELAFLKKIRGGRLNALKFKLQHPRDALLHRPRSGSRSSRSSQPLTPIMEPDSQENGTGDAQTPESRNRHKTRSRSNSAFGPAAAMAGIVAGSIAGWSPVERPEDGTSIRTTHSRSRSELEAQEGGVSSQPVTKPNEGPKI